MGRLCLLSNSDLYKQLTSDKLSDAHLTYFLQRNKKTRLFQEDLQTLTLFISSLRLIDFTSNKFHNNFVTQIARRKHGNYQMNYFA